MVFALSELKPAPRTTALVCEAEELPPIVIAPLAETVVLYPIEIATQPVALAESPIAVEVSLAQAALPTTT